MPEEARAAVRRYSVSIHEEAGMKKAGPTKRVVSTLSVLVYLWQKTEVIAKGGGHGTL
jgi:hypothetical protein